MRPGLALLLLCGIAAGWIQAVAAEERQKVVLGFVEQVIVSEQGFMVKARLDTGAATSSLDAHNIRRIRRGEQRYVRFDVINPETGAMVTLERPLVRNVRIRQHGGGFMRRPVVSMPLCVGDILQKVEVSLTARSEFLYPLLVGRSAMQGLIIVDPELSMTTPPDCDLGEFEE